jgi:hypothetical protein
LVYSCILSIIFKEGILKIAPELVIGNAILSIVEKEENAEYITFNRFYNFSKELNNELIKKEDNNVYSDVSSEDVYDTVYILSKYLEIDKDKTEELRIRIRRGDIIDELKRMLNIYYKSITPKWLSESMANI